MSLPRLHAPRDDRGILAVPPLAQAGALLARNQHDLANVHLDLLGKPLAELRRLARADAWAAVRRYHAEASEPLPAPPAEGQHWLVAGPQPELFHPGVWSKNFALNGGSRNGTYSVRFRLNLVVDNDAANRLLLLRLPAERVSAPGQFPMTVGKGESPLRGTTSSRRGALFASLPERRTQPYDSRLAIRANVARVLA